MQPRAKPSTPRKKIEQYSYSLNDIIGKGYSSVVYLGRNDDTCTFANVAAEPVAMKVIDLKGLVDQFAREMLQSEIKAIKTLNHPNILRCYDVFTTANNCYIVMEFCNEGDLANHLHKRGRLGENETCKLMADIAAGFVQMARSGYLHRDLKLANVLLKNGTAKIADFGFAKLQLSPGIPEKYNVGSPLYMPPESLSKNIYSVKSDIWALGVMVFEMLTGKTPWECRTEKELLEKITRVPVEVPSALPEDIKLFLRGCLQPDQTRRFGLEEFVSCSFVAKLLATKISLRERSTGKNGENLLLAKTSSTKKARHSELTEKKGKENVEPPVASSLAFQQFPSMLQDPSLKDHPPAPSLVPSVLQQNNAVLVYSINTCRLLFKIVEQLKKNFPAESHLIHVLSKEVLLKISYLRAILQNVSGDESAILQGFELKQMKRYLDQEVNPSIRRYKLVVAEYSKKYGQELAIDDIGIRGGELRSCLVTFTRMNLEDSYHRNELLFHWIVEHLLLAQHDKDSIGRPVPLEEVIQPRLQPTQDQIQQRLRLLQL